MPVNIKRGWSFKSDLSLREMMDKLNAVWGKPWVEGDSAYHDYLGGRLNKDGVARIYQVGDGFVANLLFYSKETDFRSSLDDAEATLLNKAFTVIGAREMKSCDPYE